MRLVAIESLRDLAILKEYARLAGSHDQFLIQNDAGTFELRESVSTRLIANICATATLTGTEHKRRQKNHETYFHKIHPAGHNAETSIPAKGFTDLLSITPFSTCLQDDRPY